MPVNSIIVTIKICIGARPGQLAKNRYLWYISTSYMVTEVPSTARARRLRERRSRGVVLVAPVEVGEGGVGLLVSSGLLKEHETRDRKAVGEACLAALEQWSMGRGARSMGR